MSAHCTSCVKCVRLASEREVARRQTVRIVRGQRERHAAPPDVDIGVMVGFLGGKSHLHGERYRLGEARKNERPAQNLAFAGPLGQLAQSSVDLGLGQLGVSHGFILYRKVEG
jgi:hypothetical protein